MKMNNWIINKICTFLKLQEGCHVGDIKAGTETSRAYIQDAFGYRYEVEVRCLGRIVTDPAGTGNQGSFLVVRTDTTGEV